MLKLVKQTSLALASTLLLSGCVLDEDSDGYSIDVQLSDVVKGVAEVTVKVTGDDVEGQSISVNPHMKMVGGMEHGTPFSNNHGTLDGNGEFKTTAYFLMPSAMGDRKMGDWSINVEFNGAIESFPITVNMMMMDKKKLLGSVDNDSIGHMQDTEARPYYLFDLGRKTMGNMDEFSVYISARESMFDYGSIYSGAILNQGESSEYSVAPLEVTMCLVVNDACQSWASTTTDNKGTFTATDLGLTGTSSDIIRVKVSIQDEVKTITLDKTNDDINNPVTYDYAEFTFPDMNMPGM